MNRVAVQPYYKIIRTIDGLDQRMEEQAREMILYEDRIVTKHRHFPIKQVFDLSYRPMGDGVGFLYLHTQQGVYSYTLKDDPESFITAFKNLNV